MGKKDVEIWELIEVLALIVALAAVVIFVLALGFNRGSCLIFTEPVWGVRVGEIAMGIAAAGVLFVMIWKKMIR